jgi:hypothetical protein
MPGFWTQAGFKYDAQQTETLQPKILKTAFSGLKKVYA